VTAHLTDAELRAFASGILTSEDLLRADDHLSECEQCRTLAARSNDAAGRISDLRAQLNDPATPHLSDDDLLLFVKHQLPDATREAATHHLNVCSTCAAQVGELREWAAGDPKRVNWSRLAIAAAALLAVLAPAAIWRFRAQDRATTPSSLAGLEALAAADQTRVRTAVDAGVAPLPPFMSEVIGSREVLMGPAGTRGVTFDLLAPVGTGVLEERPQFRWQTLDRAEGYVVTVFDERSNVVARSPRVTGTNWTPADSLGRGRTYVWQVAADRGGETVTAPVSPAPPARFHIIDAPSAEVLQRMELAHAQSHVLLGILYMEHGVVAAAAVHLRQVRPTDEHAALAGRSLERLAAISTRPLPPP
jgi:hypothetical protein